MISLKLKNDKQIFNLMDTNGRRSDVINALQCYLTILDDILRNQKLVWKSLPESIAQFEFYSRAIAMSPDVFKQHDKFDKIMSEISSDFKNALKILDTSWFQNNYNDYSRYADTIDKNVEARARHYTSNLVKLGFADNSRNITEVGDILLGNIPIHKDTLETLLPLNNVNIIYLRQLLKLRIFDNSGTKYYSPFCMAIYILLKKKRVSQDEFCEMIQGLSPYCNVNYDNFINNYKKNDIIQMYIAPVPSEIDNDDEINAETFKKYFTNKKSRNAVFIYYKFYRAVRNFIVNKTNDKLDTMLDIYENNKPMLNKAFGYGDNIFKNKRENKLSVAEFLKTEKVDFFTQRLNKTLYLRFMRSKTMDIIREYSDTTIRIFKATGLISFENGYVELVYSDLYKHIFDEDIIKSMISGNDDIKSYEEDINGIFCKECSVISILKLTEKDIKNIEMSIRKEFGNVTIKEVLDIIRKRRKSDFITFIEKTFPEDVIKEILSMFSDRSNDSRIKERVSPDATIPTIYEYIVGIAWYYFSNKTIDILSSFNLTLSANFEPLTHAGGGMGDIVIYNKNNVIMLEVTLMNANSQKRGEWEPVLRHAVNLKTENEDKEVTTFFIADNFDFNTINIWKAVSSVPLQSSANKSKYTENVIIMPISSNELIKLIDHKYEYDAIIHQIRQLFLKDITLFDTEWRNKFINLMIQ